MRFERLSISTLLLIGLGTLLATTFSLVTTASAFVTVEHVDDTNGATLGVGDVFNVNVSASNDGALLLTGLFTSTQWDPSEVMLLSATSAPLTIFSGPDGMLNRLSDPADLEPFAGDPEGILRTVQYGANPYQYGGSGSDVLITTLTFQVISGGDGVADISAIFALGDGMFGTITGGGGTGSYTYQPSDYSLISTSVSIIPEPSTTLLLGIGLLALARRRAIEV